MSRRKSSLNDWFANAQVALAWGAVLLMLGIGCITYLTRVNQTSIAGYQVRQLRSYQTTLAERNTLLEEAIAQEQALGRLEARSNTLEGDFVATDPATIEKLEVVVMVEPSPEDVEPEQPELFEVPAASLGEALWSSLRRNVEIIMAGNQNRTVAE